MSPPDWDMNGDVTPSGYQWLIDILKAELDRVAGIIADRNQEIAQLKQALRMCARNDSTTYDHHQPRRWDGKKPDEMQPPGSIWLTPREIARGTLGEPSLATFDDREQVMP